MAFQDYAGGDALPSLLNRRYIPSTNTPAEVEFIIDHDHKAVALISRCPSGDGDLMIHHFTDTGNDPVVTWNGSYTKPTIPELIRRPCGWCGFLTDGYWRKIGHH